MKSFIQKPGETLYIPHMMYHSVWNISPTVAFGDNPLYESSFNEWAGFDFNKDDDLKFLFDRILLKTNGEIKSQILRILEQIEQNSEYMKSTEYSTIYDDTDDSEDTENVEKVTTISGRVSSEEYFRKLSGRKFY